MEPAPYGAPAPNNALRAEVNPPAAGMVAELSMAVASGRAAFSSLLELMSLEARRAGVTLMWMVVLGVIAAICIVTAWLVLMVALTMGAIALGCSPILAVIALAASNLIAGAALIYRCIGMSRDLLFSATRRQVAGQSPATESPS